MIPDTQGHRDPRVISYNTLRNAVGILGISFPVVMAAGSILSGECREIQSSISAYYYTGMRNLFTGIIFAIAFFLFAYKGYEKKDAIAGNLASVFALGVAFFPTSITGHFTSCIPNPIDTGLSSTIHFITSGGFFLTLSYFSICLFTKSVKEPSEMKHKRNKLYRTCGFVMLVCILLIGVYSNGEKHGHFGFLSKADPVFWLETIALWAFGFSWLTKGETFLTDKKK